MPKHTATSRRAEYAEATKQAIVASARRLFSEQGYFATKVDAIAADARVAPATVYAVTGGKQGLLQTLIDAWTTAPSVAEAYERIAVETDPEALIRFVADLTIRMRKDWGDIMRVVLATAPNDPTASEGLALAINRYRGGYVTAAERLAELKGLRPGLTVDDAVDLLWFYFGLQSLFTLIDDNHWSYEKAETWLTDQAIKALL
jgi:AcrR family transcriptional regulator